MPRRACYCRGTHRLYQRVSDFSIRLVTTTTTTQQRQRRHRISPRCPRSNSNKNITINYYFYLKDLSGSFIRRSPSASPSSTNNTILHQPSMVTTYKIPKNNHKHPQLIAVNLSNRDEAQEFSAVTPLFFTERTIIEATGDHP